MTTTSKLRRAGLAAVAALAATASSRRTLADELECESSEPAQVSLTESAIDAPRSACMRSSAAAFARGLATIDPSNFYGTIAGSLLLRGRWLTSAGIELEGGARVLDVRFAQNAVLTDTETSVGPLSLGLARSHRVSWFGQAGSAAAQLRLEVPRTASGLDLTALTVMPAALWTARLSRRWHLHARVALLLWSARVSRGVDTRRAAILGSDATVMLGRSIAMAFGLEGQSGWHRGALDHLLVRGQISLGTRTRVSLSLGAPLVGDERTTGIVTLGLETNL